MKLGGPQAIREENGTIPLATGQMALRRQAAKQRPDSLPDRWDWRELPSILLELGCILIRYQVSILVKNVVLAAYRGAAKKGRWRELCEA